MAKQGKVKVLLAQFPLETHSRGILTVAGMLRDAGMEVVLMGNAAMKVGAIAEASGFASPYYFCRQFKRRYHVSPGQYYRRIYHAK